ncbi:hypothetical protein JRO89_XS13G0233700 [Xanthoceras sorbifolium]|uniref:Cytochrome P450 n=1 Tax=Xanthoceras sorbifolium TaxID=99658 RepID=A0ABQ8H9N0_9ROSI|nr:hypothetical protein JRO89_XS13G0233700 [Xanthoceras sorbifolium]
MIHSGFRPHSYSIVGNALIDMYCRNENVEVAQMVFEHMESKDIASWTSLLNGFIMCNDLGQESGPGFGNVSANESRKDTVITVVSVLSGCADMGALDLGSLKDILRDAERDVFCWTTLISGYAFHGRGNNALEVFNDIKSQEEVTTESWSKLSSQSSPSMKKDTNKGGHHNREDNEVEDLVEEVQKLEVEAEEEETQIEEDVDIKIMSHEEEDEEEETDTTTESLCFLPKESYSSMAVGLSGFWVDVLVGIVVGLLLISLLLNHFLSLSTLKKLGPGLKGSFGWPLLGETLSFLKPHHSNSPGSFLQDHCSRYGKVFRTHLFFSPTVVSCDPELNYFILQNEGKLFQCSYPKPVHGILGKVSMLVAVGDTHKRLRNVALSLVTITKSKPEFLHDIERTAIQILDSWKDKPQFTFNVIVKHVLGLTPEEPVTTKILEDFLTFMRGFISLPIYIPGTPYARAVKFIWDQLALSEPTWTDTTDAIKFTTYKDQQHLIQFLMALHDTFEPTRASLLHRHPLPTLEQAILLCVDTLSEDEKVSFVLDCLFGGYETISLLMAMAVHFLAQSPAALQQLKVINEALRYGNVVKYVHGEALKDVKFRDYLIPSGWKVLPVFTAVHLDPSLHANAAQFHPWRWERLEQTCKKFTPFGGGSRSSPGSDLAKVEVAFFLHHLVQNFRLRTEDD